MGVKHKKTRKEKIRADFNHQVYILKNKSSTDSVLDKDIPFSKPTLITSVNQNFYSNTHVLRDVLKTGILTCAIIAAEVVLFFLLKRHIITLPMLKY